MITLSGGATLGLWLSIEEYGPSFFGPFFIVFNISEEQKKKIGLFRFIVDPDENRLTFLLEEDEESGAWDIVDCSCETMKCRFLNLVE